MTSFQGIPVRLDYHVLYLLFLGSDFNSTTTEITFDSSKSSCCIEISTFNDILIEDPEIFNVAIITADPAVSIGNDVPVTIEDSNEGEVFIAIAESAYRAFEGETVAVCVQVTSEISNLQRDIVLSVVTISGGDAEGNWLLNHG